MKKALLPVAILAALPAVALADVTVYGRANVSVDLLDDGADYSEVAMSSNSSRLGFRANRELEGGLTAMVQIEQEIDFSDSGSNWASRDTFVGLRGDFGMFRLGKFDTPFKRARGPANLFGDQVGDLRNLTRAGNARFDERTPNTIHYQTPDFSGFRVNFAYSLHEGRDNRGLDDEALSLSLTYQAGPLDLAAAYESFDDDASRGGRDAFRFAIGYKIDALTLVGFFQTADHNNDAFDSDVFGVGASYQISEKTLLKAHYFNRSADPADSDSALLAVGLEYRIARPLRILMNFASVANDDNANLTPWNQARTTGQPGSFGDSASGFSLGLRYDF
ncbi:MAG: porin [Wenzhouxiangella sp.]|nr:MAG: porin [Wenzhouxiangella sp.]